MSVTSDYQVIAVSYDEHKEYGCPYCGYRSGFSHISGQGAVVWNCAECRKTSILLAQGVTESPFVINDNRPVLQVHPRKGIPSHGRPDIKPEGGGEFFQSRGIGLEWNLACFCCGTKDNGGRISGQNTQNRNLLNNIAAFVKCKAAGERVVQMFGEQSGGAWLDYRKHEPDRVQVKIGACDQHLPNLQQLERLTEEAKGIITQEMINQTRTT